MDSGAGHGDPAVWVFSTSGFHRLFATKPVRSETSKQYGGQVATIVSAVDTAKAMVKKATTECDVPAAKVVLGHVLEPETAIQVNAQVNIGSLEDMVGGDEEIVLSTSKAGE